MVEENKANFKEKVQKSIVNFIDQLKKIRTGRASGSVLDSVMVNYYGTPTPISQVGSITIPEARMIVVHPWDKSMIIEIEKAIQKAGLGFNPTSDGNVIRIVIPALTEDTRKQIVKDAKNIAEHAKITIRNLRRDANDHLKKTLKNHEIAEDQERDGLDDIQKLTDDFIKEIDTILEKKEKEILEI